MAKRNKTQYPGVYWIEVSRTGGRNEQTDKSFIISYLKDGKQHEERVGRARKDSMTAARASAIRLEKIEGNKLTKIEEKAEKAEKAKAKAAVVWTFSEIWNEYKKDATARGNKAVDMDESRFNKYLRPVFGKKEPRELVKLDVERLRRQLMKTLKQGTVQNIIEVLVRLSNWAGDMEIADPIRFKVKRPKVNNEVTRCLSEEQVEHLLAACDEDDCKKAACAIKIALFSGMRYQEILKLKKADINFEHGTILIRDPKGKVDATIPLNDLTRKVIKDELPDFGSDYLFPGNNGGAVTSVRKAANRIKARAGLPKEFRIFHDLRHSFASWLVSKGATLYEVQHLLTHKSPQVTQRYAHVHNEALQRASSLTNEVFSVAI